MRIAVIQFPGSNCERETMMAIKRADMQPVEFLWNEPLEKLRGMDGYVIAGGFSYEDRSRAGVIAALDPVMQEIRLQSETGKPILGICNGAQILVETGLVPGLENNKVGMVLTENKRMAHGKILGTGYYNAWINMRLSDQYQRNAFTHYLTPHNILHVPVAHGQGRFVMTEALLQEIMAQGLHVFQYCNEQGEIDDHFPVNPNGSMANIAAISNKAGNVMAMMPHPERTTNGDAIFQSMRHYIAKGKGLAAQKEKVTPLYYYPRKIELALYQQKENVHALLTELIITDNQALTVQNTLRQLGMAVAVRRYVRWEVDCEDNFFQEIKKTSVLFNPRKEKPWTIAASKPHEITTKNDLMLLVLPKEDIYGLNKLQILRDHFDINNINTIRHGILWHFDCHGDHREDLLDRILNLHIIFNPYAHDCYQYVLPAN